MNTRWFRWNNDNVDRFRDYEIFLRYLLVDIAANCENSSESDKLLVNERYSECHKAVVSDSEVHKADEVSEVRLVGEIDDELHEVSEFDYDEVWEVGEADEWRRAGWGLWSLWWLMSDELDNASMVGSQYSTESGTDEWCKMITEFDSSWRPQHSVSPSHAPKLETIFFILLCYSNRLASICS